MTKQLYEDALADVKQLRQVAEDNAKRAIIEAVSPRIKDLIEQQLFGDDDESFDDELTIPTTLPITPLADDTSTTAMTLPDDEGKVTLDVDALGCEPCSDPVEPPMFGDVVPTQDIPEEEYILGLEALTTLKPMLDKESKTVNAMKTIKESVNMLSNVGPLIRRTTKFKVEVDNAISRVENMYEYVLERVTDPNKKKVLENKLESYYKKLNELKMNKLNKMLNEDDSQLDLGADGSDDGDVSPGELTLKLTGLPDDVDLSGVGVDLISDESDDGDEDFDIVDDEGGDEGDDEDLGDFDLDSQQTQAESVGRLSDNTIVEIDEGMLRREIARMKRIRESAGVDASVIDNFGGGTDDGEAFLDGDVTTEADDTDGEMLDELDDVAPVQAESVQRKIRFEKSVQSRLKNKIGSIKAEARTARPSKKAVLQKEYKTYAQKFNASVKRERSLTTQLKEARSNNASTVSGAADKKLRAQLAEQNLLNAKLIYANKLLQVETLTKRQKAQVISKLDEARTAREVKLVYESLVKTIAPTRSSLSESRKPGLLGGSSSKVMRSGASNINEGFETERWATLAGLKK